MIILRQDDARATHSYVTYASYLHHKKKSQVGIRTCSLTIIGTTLYPLYYGDTFISDVRLDCFDKKKKGGGRGF